MGKDRKDPEELHDRATRYPRKTYEREVLRLQAELVKLKEWVRVGVPITLVSCALSNLMLILIHVR